MKNNYISEAKVFKAFCDENRLEILTILKNGEKCACVLLENLKIGQSTLSHHMKILCDSGIVSARKEGKWTHYSIDKNEVLKTQQFMREFIENNEDNKNYQCK